MARVLFAWIGFADLEAAETDGAKGAGPIAQTLAERDFDRVVLLNNLVGDPRIRAYERWLKKRVRVELLLRDEPLSYPTHHADIYQAVTRTVAWVLEKFGDKAKLTFHLSPGTPAMASIWIIVAKTRLGADPSLHREIATVHAACLTGFAS